MTISFENRVAIVTGAGAGLGRSHALELARRGAKVLVNDFGGGVDGTGGSSEPAEKVAEEIREAGGEAISHGADVTNPEQVADMVRTAMDQWGRIDILINNAGILRDSSFMKMEMADFDKVMAVHLMGSVICTKAVWPIMREQGYGRLLMTTSSSGLYGNFGQSNYGAAKMALVGFMNTLHLEGEKYNIRVNSLGPAAATRMTEGLLPPPALEMMTPESVTPAAIFLVAEDAPSRVILNATAGAFSRTYIEETQGVAFAPGDQTAENIAANWDEISDPKTAVELPQGAAQVMKFAQMAGEARKS
ncbi:SDR family NAD(P)-dependent oxidoreductase [Parvularcula marina]|uniref:SDR family NAD(P)-dependent oxidoreductase n=1 Tax=Parvularcula marina TaxID=2292771 RepID=A0A371RGW1_9PROT|nr:SDR family NAD(P)-dependent oxidoreductase [Parvularcula marina]RFB04698.1 SDR family NAD(P)-dependent oxidoreductase [Parvularcula marina]